VVPTTEMVAPRLAVAGAVAVTSMSAYCDAPMVTAGKAVALSPASVVALTVTSPRSVVLQVVAVESKWRETVMVAVTFVPNAPAPLLAFGSKANGSVMVQVGVLVLGSKPVGRSHPVTEPKSTPLGSVKFNVSSIGRASSGLERVTVTVMTAVLFGARLFFWGVVPVVFSVTAKPGVAATAANPVRATKRDAAAATGDFEKPAKAIWDCSFFDVPSVQVQPSLNRDRSAPRRPKHCRGIQVGRALGGRIYQQQPFDCKSARLLVSRGALPAAAPRWDISVVLVCAGFAMPASRSSTRTPLVFKAMTRRQRLSMLTRARAREQATRP